ncbi:MAG TPA: cellulose synthase operon protein YhjQ/BcsQ [Gallionellaceae bacterium]|nr:cellulose synthase operon protein YhjQ/BcsQ [Gallionellaceae bacterium]
MLSRHDVDQAEGLRRLLLPPSLRVVTVLGARVGLGATSVAVNLAAALAAAGREVLVLDENRSTCNVANTLALKPRYDLIDAVRGDKHWREVMLRAAGGVHVLPVARAMQALPALHDAERDSLLASLTAATRAMNVVLVDAAADGHSVCASLSGDEPLLLVLNPTASGITESYALLKQMAMRHGRQAFDIVVNKARNEHEARAVFDNMFQVAQRHLQVRLTYLGNIPQDDKMKRASELCKPLMEVFPAAPSALALGELARKLMLLPASECNGSNALTVVMQRMLRQAGQRHAMQY